VGLSIEIEKLVPPGPGKAMPTTKTDHPLKLVLPPDVIQKRVAELASRIANDISGSDTVFLGILNGAFIFMSDLVRNLSVPVRMDFLRLASYGGDSQSSGAIELRKGPDIRLKDRTVVVVEDIVDTGLTMQWLRHFLENQGIRDLKIASLIDKPERRKVDIKVDYVGFEIPRGFLVGYGLDFAERYRQLPGIYEVEASD
jgi:hypoxanthine phosphoribosyltransferase